MSVITGVFAREIIDSRGNPTVEAIVSTKNNTATASVPSGASTGVHEALELRDGGKRFLGKGVQKAVRNVNTAIAKALKGKALNQEEIDKTMLKLDGTQNKEKLGANAMLAVSMACARLTAMENKEPLYANIQQLSKNKRLRIPVPAFNIINGGKHAGNKLDFQEYMILPTGAKSFAEALQIGSEVYHTLKELLEKNLGKPATNVGDEGGFAPPLTCVEEPFDYIFDAIQQLGYLKKVKLGIDAAATTFCSKGMYNIEGNPLTPDKMLAKYLELIHSYPIASIEDPFAEDDFECFTKLTKHSKIQIVGDDLLCTNPMRIQRAVLEESCNCLLLKVNQIGTITEALESAKLAKNHDWNVMVSHRSGETEDTFIADLAVGLGTGQIKSGAPCRGERTAKYNRLLRIEEETKAVYGGTL